MGHKGSHPHSGAVGLEGKFLPPDITPENMNEALEAAHEEELRDKAQKHTDDAIEALADVMKEGKPDSARVQAAKAMIDYGHGKAASQKPEAVAGGRNITINIIQFGTGEKVPQTIEVEGETLDDVARRLLAGEPDEPPTRTFPAPIWNAEK